MVFNDRKTENFVQIQQPNRYTDFYLQCIVRLKTILDSLPEKSVCLKCTLFSFANINKSYKQFPICHCQSRSLVSVIYATCKNVRKINMQRNPAFTRRLSLHKYQCTIKCSARKPNFLKCFGARPP
jgi:hypothetical protein